MPAAPSFGVVFAGSACPPLELPSPMLFNADPSPHAPTVIARSTAFADTTPGAVIVTLLPCAPPGLAHFAEHEAAAILWAFTRQAALSWAPRNIRVNAISLGAAPFGPDEASDQAGRGAAAIRAVPATDAELFSTLRLIAELPSMTGQLIRLGAH